MIKKEIKSGLQFGDWLTTSDNYTIDGISFNDCICKCGIKRRVRSHPLSNLISHGCGCSNNNGRVPFSGCGDLSLSYLGSFKSGRKNKGFEWSEDLTIEFLWDLFLKQNKKCAISGLDIILIRKWSNQNKGKPLKIYQTASIDRIDNNKGYLIDNVQWVHKSINLMRGQLTVEDFISFSHIISKNNNNIDNDGNFTSTWRPNLK